MTQAIVLNEAATTPMLKHIVQVISHMVGKIKKVEQQLSDSANVDMKETIADLLQYSDWFMDMVEKATKELVDSNLPNEVENAVEHTFRNSNVVEEAVSHMLDNYDLSSHVQAEFKGHEFTSAVEDVIYGYGFDDKIEECFGNSSFEYAVERVLENYNFTDAVDDALRDIDWNDKLHDFMQNYDFGNDMREAVEKVLTDGAFKARLHVMAQEAVRKALITAANNMQGE